jgi:sugar lactone lactonase YvrE
VLANAAGCVGLLAILAAGCGGVQGQAGEEGMLPGEGFAAVPGLKGGQDLFGPYDVAENWPQPMSASLPGHENWTYSVTMDVFAESPDRILVASQGELPLLNRSEMERVRLREVGPSLVFPVNRLPLRQAGAGVPRMVPAEWRAMGRAEREEDGRVEGVDFRFEHSIYAVNRDGLISETFEQWDDIWVRPHDIEISPYDPEKHIWIVDAEGHSVRKFTNDMSELVLTLGTPGEPGEDDTHLRRPTFLVFMDANTMYLADGYDNQRVIKYDMDGNILGQWGETGESGGETRPGYWYNVHGIAVDPTTREVFVNDRENSRVQVFDEDGNYLREWTFDAVRNRSVSPMDIHSFIVTSDRKLWAADQGTHKILGYDLQGNFLYSWGSWGEYPGGLWGVHGLSTDTEGNFYTASVNNGRIQKFVPREGANPEFLVGKPWPGVW